MIKILAGDQTVSGALNVTGTFSFDPSTQGVLYNDGAGNVQVTGSPNLVTPYISTAYGFGAFTILREQNYQFGSTAQVIGALSAASFDVVTDDVLSTDIITWSWEEDPGAAVKLCVSTSAISASGIIRVNFYNPTAAPITINNNINLYLKRFQQGA